ncbi:MAG: hypothetical protein ACD_34C00352G0001 [uncultured bacterium]|nr:MAG: hypothetical protein ACD_34C00352G0001 [uncultured bacterium]
MQSLGNMDSSPIPFGLSHGANVVQPHPDDPVPTGHIPLQHPNYPTRVKPAPIGLRVWRIPPVQIDKYPMTRLDDPG